MFPLFEFWGPRASIRSSQWIADAARHVERRYHPALTLIYLPHLDYNLQRLGPSDAAIEPDLAAIDTIAADLVDLYERDGAAVIVLSEYGIVDVTTPVHLNRALRCEGLISVRVEQGLDVLDAGASAAFAVADHQIAHVYVNDPAKLGRVRDLIEQQPGVERVLGAEEKAAFGLDHPRAGDLVAIARPDAWFTYYYWEDDRRAPDFARTVDIHRKPGYDPVELFLDPRIRLPAVAVGWRLAKRKLGFRTLLDVIPLDASLVRGSHGRPGPAGDDGPLVILSGASGASGGLSLASSSAMSSTGVFDVLANAVRGR
jgi:predicted AlkP superfamily pyrophosphatase or phosphodiesterase